MSKITRSIMGGLLFTCWLMCFVFPVSLLMSFSDHTPIGAFLVQQVIDFFFLWFICGVIAHGVIGMFDEINKRRPEDRNDQTHNDQNGHDPNGETQKRLDNERPESGDHNSDQTDSGPKQ